MIITKLFASEWVDVLEIETENNGKYTYTHNPKTNGISVAVLPFRKADHENGIDILGRFEYCPAHSSEESIELCSITGGYTETQISIEECVLQELAEEAGLIVKQESLISLGTVKPSKGSTTTIHLFGVDVDASEVHTCEPTTDGSLGEKGAYCQWVNVKDGMFCKDPLVSTILLRLAFTYF